MKADPEYGIYVVNLKKDDPSPFKPRSDEEESEKESDGKGEWKSDKKSDRKSDKKGEKDSPEADTTKEELMDIDLMFTGAHTESMVKRIWVFRCGHL